ncbi:PQQ-binding-like beta-propeller repeat protein [Kitasatospora sp. NPDC088134]|uniref:protein kinase domain-containing protein n=1 Tax=Kitasatospora sp. NPDC088134 TaxID=3364071 RepID=UPI00381C16FB
MTNRREEAGGTRPGTPLPSATLPGQTLPGQTLPGQSLPGTIGPYRPVRELGAGGMGRVYLAASHSGRAVAVKVVRGEFAADPDFRWRFAAEVDAARRVGSAFTAPVVDADPTGTPPWLATAYIPGPSLGEAVRTHGPMPEQSLRLLAAGLVEALAAIHRAGLIHRDLKPSNVLLAKDGPRVIDFGISRAVDRPSFTVEGHLVGSPGYMSPEHTTGEELTPASDVFALGAVLAYAATGRPPFGTGPVHALLYRTAHEDPDLAGVPDALSGILAACLHRDPAARPPLPQLQTRLRPQAAADWPAPVAEQVARYEREATRYLRRPRPSRRSVLLASGGAALAAGAGAGWWLWRRPAGGPAAAAPEAAWTADVPDARAEVSRLDAGTVVCTGPSSASVYDRNSGRQLWHDADGTQYTTGPGRVYTVRTDGLLHALDGSTGKQLWASPPEGTGSSKIVSADADQVVLCSANGAVRGFDPTRGTVRWSSTVSGRLGGVQPLDSGRMLVSGSDKSTNFTFLHAVSVLDPAGQRLWNRNLYIPHAAGDRVYAFDQDRSLLALRAADGERIWSRDTPLSTTYQSSDLSQQVLGLLGGRLYCYPELDLRGMSAGPLIAFDPADGSTLWSTRPPTGLLNSVAVADGVLCYLADGLHGIDARTGHLRWHAGADLGGLSFLGTAGGMFLVGSVSAAAAGLYGFDPASGRQVWHYPVTGATDYWTGAQDSRGLYVLTSSRLLAFRLPG